MIKTLRITSIGAAILAAVIIVFSVVFGVRSDEKIEEFINSPTVMEKFNKAMGNKVKTSQSETSPLVKQAGSFALYLNPPKSRAPSTPTGRGGAIARVPAVTPKFKVIGTSYYEGRPDLSLALIDEPGKGLHWVRQGGQVGHLSIKQIKDSLVVVSDNGRTYELAAEQQPEPSLLEGAPDVRKPAGASVRAGGRISSRTSLPASGSDSTGKTKAASETPKPRMSTGQEQRMNELVEKLREIQRNFTSDKAGSVPNAKEKAAMMESLINKFKSSSQLSPEEAKRLGDLGRELKDVWQKSDESLPEKDGGK
jgi:hypothetical protein